MRATPFLRQSISLASETRQSGNKTPCRLISAVWALATPLILTGLVAFHDVHVGFAQVTTTIVPTQGPGDLGTTVTSTGHTIQITGGTRPSNGTNLFHSFDRFTLGQSETAQFLNTTPSLHTVNILSRVTGGNPSSIFGTIDTLSYPGANFFFMNPAGIVFGPTAALNVAGSVAFTTADYLKLADNQVFHAVTNMKADALLSTAPVAAYGFLSSTPGDITIHGSQFGASEGNSLSLVGGNITIQGGPLPNDTIQPAHLTAPSGQMNIVSTTSPGDVTASTLNDAPNIHGQSFGERGTILISQHSTIATSSESGGTIQIRGGRLVLDGATISANTAATGAQPYNGPLGNGIDVQVAHDVILDNGAVMESNASGPVAVAQGSGGIRIKAHDITISGGPDIIQQAHKSTDGSFPFSGIRSDIEPNSTAGRSGDITLEAQSIRMQDLGQIETVTTGKGNAGHIILNAVDNIDVHFSIISSVSQASSGHAGNISLTSRHGDIRLGALSFITSQAQESSSGDTGSITLMAPYGTVALTDESSILNAAYGTGLLRGMQIVADNFDLQGGSRIDVDNFSTRNPESISISLGNRFSLTDQSVIQTSTSGATPAADLSITASDIVIARSSSLDSRTFGSGAGGRIDLSAQSLILHDNSTITAGTSGIAASATGGPITLHATTHITLSNGASVTTSSTGVADAGRIVINAGQQLDLRNSTIRTEATKGRGGNIDIQATDGVRVINSQISTSVGSGEGSGGNITIDPATVVLQNSRITATADGGNGGNITITTPLFLADQFSLVDASSQFGLNGAVTIQSPISNLSGTVAHLTSQPIPVPLLFQSRCAAPANNQQGSVILSRRHSIPMPPGEWMNSPFMISSEYNLAGTPATSLATGTLSLDVLPVPLMNLGSAGILSLRQLTPPGFLVRAFASQEPTGCRL